MAYQLDRPQQGRARLADFDADGAADVFAFRADGLHTTDLSIHIADAGSRTTRRARPNEEV